jgi:hypothetical protein
VARLFEDGSMDTAFIPPTINAIEPVRALALQADGKSSSEVAIPFGGPPVNIFRFNANGWWTPISIRAEALMPRSSAGGPAGWQDPFGRLLRASMESPAITWPG